MQMTIGRRWLGALALAATIGGMAGAARAETSWTMATGYPENNFFTQNVRAFIADVDKATGGAVKIDLRANGELIKLDTIKRAVQSNQVQLGEIRLGVYGNEDSMYILDGIPNLAPDYASSMKLAEAQKPYFDALFDKAGLKMLAYVAWPGQGFYTKAPVTEPAQFDGLKIRIYSTSTQEMAQKLGFQATILPFAEVPQAFSTGLIDSLFTSAQTGLDIQVWDYAKNFTYSGTMLTKNAIIVSKKAFDRLPAEQQAALVAAGEAATKRGYELSAEAAKATEAELAAHGMTVTEASPAIQARLAEIGTEMTAEWAKTASPEQLKVLEAYQAMN